MNYTEGFLKNYSAIRLTSVSGRFLSYPELSAAIGKFKNEFSIKEIGRSFLNIPIESIQVGSGPIKILAWSQMHGNETTTTKGILDLLNLFFICKEDEVVQQISESCTLLIIPMLNPDGAARYTRENVNKIDLNRDAQELKEPESKVLNRCFEDFKPDFCFNLHDQRTIFGAGEKAYPATLSFLAPSMDEARTVTPVREKAMQVIIEMNSALQQVIPGQIGRFDDGFNINCTGDYFQNRNVPTILFECGHYQDDYSREKTREFFTYAFYTALRVISSGEYQQHKVSEYFDIPENRKSFYDVILRDGIVSGEKVDLAIQFSEVMKAGEIYFIPKIESIAPRLNSFGHREIQCFGGELKNSEGEILTENDLAEEILLNNEKLSIKTREIP